MNLNNIRKLTGGAVLKNEPMSAHTSFRTGGPAECYIVPRNTAELAGLIRYFKLNALNYTVIGNGTNLLVSDKGIKGAVIDLGRHDGTMFSMLGYEYEDDNLVMDTGAGCLLSAVGKLAAKLGGTGFEELSGIPGCVGGALVMNAGAYGREMKDVVESVEAVGTDGRIRHLNREEITFGYRRSSLQEEGYIVTRAKLVLKKGESALIEEKNAAYMKERADKQPLEYPSAGSVFKRPEGYFAGKLISDAGLKGFAIGGARVSEKHAGFIINQGGASSADIYALIKHCQKTVYDMYGVMLETEIKLLGQF